MVQLRARPAVRRVDRGIKLPTNIRTILRPNPAVVRKLQDANQAISRRKPQVIDPKPRAPVVSPKHVPKIKAAVARRRAPHHRKPPKIRYISSEMTPQSRKAVAQLKGCGKGKILIIMGNGPSLIEADVKPLVGAPKVDIMSINKPDNRVWPSKYWLFCDHTQYKRHQDLWNGYRGTIINTTAIKQKRKNSIQIRNLGGTGFSTDLTNGFYLGRSSCYAAMQVALWMGYDHIYLFGVDMRSVKIDGKVMTHYYGVNPDVQPKNREARFDNEAKHYQHAAESLTDKQRKKFTFCSSYLKYGFADRFNRMDHKKAAKKILKKLEQDSDRAPEPELVN